MKPDLNWMFLLIDGIPGNLRESPVSHESRRGVRVKGIGSVSGRVMTASGEGKVGGPLHRYEEPDSSASRFAHRSVYPRRETLDRLVDLRLAWLPAAGRDASTKKLLMTV